MVVIDHRVNRFLPLVDNIVTSAPRDIYVSNTIIGRGSFGVVYEG